MTDQLTQILQDPTRLAVLRQLDLLDSPAEEAFDRLTRLASKIVHAPVSLVSLVDTDRQFFKSAIGVPEPLASRRQTPLSHSFCKYVVASGEPLVVTDAREHPLLRDNPAVSELHVVAYLGMPLTTASGANLGSFCVIDDKPRVWTAQEIDIMRELATAVMTEIELREAKRQAEVSLRANEARLQRLTESAQDIIYRYRLVPTAALEYINPAITAITGYPRDAFYANSGLFFSLIYEEDEGLLAQLLSPGQDLNQRLILRWVHRDGSILWTEQANVLLHNETGRLVAIEGIVRDITEQKTAEAALRASEANFHRLFAKNPAPMWVYDQQTLAFLDVNEATVVHYGYTRDEFLNLCLTDIQAVGKGAWQRVDISSVQSDFQAQDEQRHRLKDGQIIDVELLSYTLDFGERRAVLVVAHDMTARREAEQALRESEERFRRVFESAPIAISISRHGMHRYVNPAFARLFGFDSPARVIGTPILDSVAPSDRARIAEQLTREAASPLVSSFESPSLHRDGSELPLYVQVGPIEWHGETAYVAFLTDLTERKRTEAEALQTERLRVELEKEREIVELKERFIAMVTHEFRTPLTVITMASGLLEQRFDLFTPEKRLRQIQHIQTQTQYMTDLLNDVLTLSTARAGKLKFNPAPLDLGAVCDRIFEQFQLTNQNGHRLIFDAQGDLSNLVMDEDLIRHILVNLLSNAIKYSPEGGDVRFEVERQSEVVVFRFRDQGIGIPQADVERLFEPFHRAKNALNIGGTGLGLPIVKSNVEAHGGTITVESTEGVGTTFTVRLPVVISSPTP